MRKSKLHTEPVLLLTGCISPNSNDILVVRDAEVRKQQYIRAINWYLENTPYPIVFCENSGTDISSCFDSEVLRSRLELLTFEVDNCTDHSKAYRELEILGYAFNHSQRIHQGNIFVKVTGRLIYLNIQSATNYFVNKVNEQYGKEIICTDMGQRYVWADCRFFFFTRPFINRLLTMTDMVDSFFGGYFERAFAAAIYYGRKNAELQWHYLPSPQKVDGVSGSLGTTYNTPMWKFVFEYIIHQLKRLLYLTHILPYFKRQEKLRYLTQIK